MAKNFNTLRERMTPERRARNKADADRALLKMNLQELRQNVAGLSQNDVAEILEVTQGYVSRLERQDDMLLSNLYAYVQAMGGELEIRARFPDREVLLKSSVKTENVKQELAKKQTG